MMSHASATHSLHSAVPPRPSSLRTSTSSLPHHEHTLVACGCSPGGVDAASSSASLGTLNSPVVPTLRPPPSDLWHVLHTITSSPPSSGCAQIGQCTTTGYPVAARRPTGSVTIIFVPVPASVSTSMRPPCSLITACDVARPRPVPRCLVVMNGSNMCATSSFAMPGPSSTNTSLTASPWRCASTRTCLPPSAAAS